MEGLLAAARAGELPPLVVVYGDRALAEPLAERLLEGLGELWGVVPQPHRFGVGLDKLIADLRTIALFEPGKLVALYDSGLLADRAAAAELLTAAREVLPWSGGGEDLEGPARVAALRLLQVCRLNDLDPAGAPPEQVLGALPAELFGGGRGGDSAAAVRAELVPLLAAAVEAGLRGRGEDELGLLADLLRDGLPERHLLVLVESAFDPRHPLAVSLAERGGLRDAGRLAKQRDGRVDGLDALVADLERETGVRLRPDAQRELAERTLRIEDGRRGGPSGGVDADSAARFAAEYRKLASLTGEAVVDRRLVVANVEDRGQEEVWPILDAIGDGRPAEALEKIWRRLAAAEDRVLERLSLFSLLAGFARNLALVGGVLSAGGTRKGEKNYPRFKARLAPELQGEIEGLPANPLRGMHAYRLHRIYLAASRFPSAALAALPSRTLETERRLKGDGGAPDAALASYVVDLAGALSSGQGAGGGSRARAAGDGRS